MYSKFAAAVVLTAASVMATAAPSYEVTIKGEEPVHVTLDGAGLGYASSKEQAFNVPAVSVELWARGSGHDELKVQVVTNKPVMASFRGTDNVSRLELPRVITSTYIASKELKPTQRMEILDARSSAYKDGPYVTITRRD